MSVLTKKGINFISQLTSDRQFYAKEVVEGASDFLKNATLPDSRSEFWKYTRLTKLNAIEFQNREVSESAELEEIGSGALRLTFVNGKLTTALKDLSLPEGLSIQLTSKGDGLLSETKLDSSGELFSAINTLYLTDILEINLAKNARVDRGIEIVHFLSGDSTLVNFKTIVRCAPFSSADISYLCLSTSSCESALMNDAFEIDVDTNAHLTLNKLQFEAESAFHVSNEVVDLGRDATFTMNTFTLNGLLVRNNVTVRVNGENSTANLFGAYVGKGNQHTDNHTVIDHRVAHCQSNERYKGVMDGHATGVFNGKVFVRKDAQKVNAFQSNANVLLSKHASVNSKPELEIYADDVKCSHGSTTGQLDDDAIFYLKSRGISKEAAERLLVEAFMEDVFEHVTNEAFRAYVRKCLQSRFHWNAS